MRVNRPAKNPVAPQPLIAVRNVRASAEWYRVLLDGDSLAEHEHRDLYDRIHSGGEIILQLHAWDEEEHPNLVNADAGTPGHGVLLWFEVNDFEAAVARVRSLGAQIVLDAHVNPRPAHREIWVRDPDGYVVVLAGPDGETRGQD